MNTFSDLIGLWPNAVQLANDIGVPPVNVRTWRYRNSIPPEFWNDVVAAADLRGIEGVTVAAMATIAAAGRNRDEAAE